MAQEVIEFPISGKVIGVNVQQGSKVKEGDIICILESMKMENPILTPVSGTVTKIEISPGQVVEAGALVAIIEY